MDLVTTISYKICLSLQKSIKSLLSLDLTSKPEPMDTH